MGLAQRRNHGPCWCDRGCPPDTWPYEQYWVEFANVFVIGNLYPNPKLYRFKRKISFGCEWEVVAASGGLFTGEILERRELGTSTPEVLDYEWRLKITYATILWQWSIRYIWDLKTQPYPVPNFTPASCSAIQQDLLIEPPVPPLFARITAAYPDACDDNDWPQKRQDKLPYTVPHD